MVVVFMEKGFGKKGVAGFELGMLILSLFAIPAKGQ